MKEYDVIIIGAGPTGIAAALNITGKKTLLIDANEKIGGKIKVSGGGRCNITNNKEVQDFLNNVAKNAKFLYPTFTNYSPKEIIEYLEKNKIKLKEEEDNKIFPQGSDAKEFLWLFERKLKNKPNIDMQLNYFVDDIRYEGSKFYINDRYVGKEIVMAAGGASYPHISQGYTGYNLLEDLSHTKSELKPASTPLVVTNDLISSRKLQGISLDKCKGELLVNGKKKKSLQKDIIITHFGLSGPLALDLSGYIKEQLDYGKKVDLKLKVENPPKKIVQELNELNEITFPISDVKGFKTAFVTNGGIKLNEVDPQTLMSKKVPNLYIGGEILDIHAITGGYNIAICFCEGKLIGNKISENK